LGTKEENKKTQGEKERRRMKQKGGLGTKEKERKQNGG
jgi:hypothetical protein